MQPAADYSWNTYDDTISHIISTISPLTILDVGAGAGKYADLIRAVKPDAHITALELGEESIKKHNLASKYNLIMKESGNALIESHPLLTFDLVILGDVIEHMRKSEGMDFLNWLNYRTTYIVIVVPEAMIMSRDPWYEGHNSVWTERDFAWHDNWCVNQFHQAQLFILRGYRASELTLSDLCDTLNKKDIPLTHDGLTQALILTHVNTMKTDVRPGKTPDSVTKYWWRHR